MLHYRSIVNSCMSLHVEHQKEFCCFVSLAMYFVVECVNMTNANPLCSIVARSVCPLILPLNFAHMYVCRLDLCA